MDAEIEINGWRLFNGTWLKDGIAYRGFMPPDTSYVEKQFRDELLTKYKDIT